MNSSDAIVQLRGVSRYFGGVTALDNVNFSCKAGSIHGILGENGAGKSTLIKILSGVLGASEGQILNNGKQVSYRSTAEATADGIVCIFQELSLVPDLTVAENIFIDQPPRRMGMIDNRKQRQMAVELLARIKCEDVDPDAHIRELSLSRRQMIEIAKALAKNPRVLILDEATSALTSNDVETVYDLMNELRADGVACIFISHRMKEVDALCDRLSVFRNGQHIQSFDKGGLNETEIVQLMIGREITAQYPPKRSTPIGETTLSVSSLRWENSLKGVDLQVNAGEIVGLGGLDGQGHKELLLGLFGALRGMTGEITFQGGTYKPSSPAQSKRQGLALVPEDRKTEGLMLEMSIGDNILLPNYKSVSQAGVINGRLANEAIAKAIELLQIKVGSADDPVETLSGGNQQKVVIAKWLMLNPDIILLNDPTRGIDVGTKQEIYRLMRDLVEAGKSVLLYSTDYAELIGCCDRVCVMYDGRIVSELEGDTLTEEAIVAASLNIHKDDPA
ncbi:monosaccharide ABC transporter ATP-binding protein, CUT2 family (TC 3.A.1.2.-) [Sulfitobacter marinus]|uniref:Monosaccharide ABC transporter ATP-binding protein, CUT2 family (TC 3.A.1.2.-) n=1 Tax=Sulfitobacter marinus TaxID=394264 RepID=A0A1I6RS34_9RHOB|nr:sugar ABC transporter ATP-binding protein [Sulfitobacter marinus]SFS67527.1 monosaccharide ABC transporter ATP-binding protein, CUT2 family (TC 3.A.1.2.-) [Sulfitobacter marinus]